MIFETLDTYGHEQVVFCHNKDAGLKAIIAIHNTVLGPALGGTRMWPYKSEAEALNDVLRLSRGMTYKNAVAGLNIGGGKAVIIGDPATDKSEALFRAFGQFVESLGGRYITAEDVGIDVNDMEYVYRETEYVTGVHQVHGGSGDPSPFTAYGTLQGLMATLNKKYGDEDVGKYSYAVQGLGGLMSVTGPSRQEIADDAPGGGPQKVGVAVADLFTGMYASTAILAALRHRDATGQGQAIDMALLDTQVAMLANLGANYLATGVAPQRAGNAHQNIVPYQVFEVAPAADGHKDHLILAVGNDSQYAKFCAVAGHPELATDPRYARNQDRVRNRLELVPLLQDIMRTRNKAAWLAALEAAKVPCGAINNIAEVFDDPQVRARGMVTTWPHPINPGLHLVSSPIKLSATPVRTDRPPPLLGEQTDEVLRTLLGYSEAHISALKEGQVI